MIRYMKASLLVLLAIAGMTIFYMGFKHYPLWTLGIISFLIFIWLIDFTQQVLFNEAKSLARVKVSRTDPTSGLMHCVYIFMSIEEWRIHKEDGVPLEDAILGATPGEKEFIKTGLIFKLKEERDKEI